MSAITGIFYRDGRSVFFDQIKKMNECLSHRGPNGNGIWINGSIALGHQMLHTTPESLNEKLPFEDKNTGLIIVADARIDNRDELAQILGLKNIKMIPDSTFILKSYEKWGEHCPEKFLGDFAFVLWDPQNEKLFCARDHMGVKPLYYYLSEELFIFATEIKALFTNYIVPHKLNELLLPSFFSYNKSGESTFYDGIFRLNAATSLTLNKKGVKIKKYWELDPELEIIMDSDEDYIKAYREIFAEAIKCRLRSAFPVGFELSGGLDSSSIVCMVKNIQKNNEKLKSINTYSLIFRGYPKGDESRYIQKVIETGGIRPHLIHGENISLLDNVDYVLWYQDQPYNAPFLAVKWKAYEMMRNNDIRILFSGTGGDDVVSYGQNYLKELALNFKWKRLITETQKFSKNYNLSFRDVFKTKIFLPMLPKSFTNLGRKILFRENFEEPFFLNSNFLRRLEKEKHWDIESLYFPTERDYKTAKAHHHNLLLDGLEETLEMLDHGSSAHLIEPRYPYLDKRMIEFCYGIPSEMKFKSGWSRYIQRIAMGGIIPSEIQWRTNKGVLGAVLQNNLLSFEGNRFNTLFNGKNALIGHYMDLNVVEKMYRRYASGEDIINPFVINLWKVLLLSIWFEKNNFQSH